MPLQATSGAASYDGFGGGVAAVPNYIEDVFSTWLATGTGGSNTQTVNNGVNLSTYGGLVWGKSRNVAGSNHILVDTARGVNTTLSTDNTGAQITSFPTVSSFLTTGFTATNYVNSLSDTFAFWTFREQPKFFDIVTYTGTGTDPLTLSHNLQSVPGCIMIKCTSTASNWRVHSTALDMTLTLNTTNAGFTPDGLIKNLTSSTFQVNNSADVNSAGATYVAYLFAHNAGGFGLTGTDNVISCGSVSATGGVNNVVNLGYEPQLVIIKSANIANDWHIIDNMRGFTANNGVAHLFPNSSTSEYNSGTTDVCLTSTGFTLNPDLNGFNGTGTYIYIAIRRGPMKVPTDATKVFNTVTATGGPPVFTSGFVTDMSWTRVKNVTATGFRWVSRLLNGTYTDSSTTAAESALAQYSFDYQNGWRNATVTDSTLLSWSFQRAPSTFDEVCWTGNNGSNQRVNHNLGVVPELIIYKGRNKVNYWRIYYGNINKYIVLNLTDAEVTYTNLWGSSAPTATDFGINCGSMDLDNFNAVAYLWATNAGVTKVGSYTGNGSSQTINCGFTGGSRLVLIIRTDASGDRYVWDSARGIVSGNDPHLSLNSTAAEVTTDDTIDTDSTGFIVNQVSATNCNVSGATYIFLSYA